MPTPVGSASGRITSDRGTAHVFNSSIVCGTWYLRGDTPRSQYKTRVADKIPSQPHSCSHVQVGPHHTRRRVAIVNNIGFAPYHGRAQLAAGRVRYADVFLLVCSVHNDRAGHLTQQGSGFSRDHQSYNAREPRLLVSSSPASRVAQRMITTTALRTASGLIPRAPGCPWAAGGWTPAVPYLHPADRESASESKQTPTPRRGLRFLELTPAPASCCNVVVA